MARTCYCVLEGETMLKWVREGSLRVVVIAGVGEF